jgi:hypothetical protein
MNREKQLDELIEALEKLTAILVNDPNCQWIRHFEVSLDKARQLRNNGFVQKDLNFLSGNVMSVFGGMGSFSDYAPIIRSDENGKHSVISGMEDLSHWPNLVHTRALELRVEE